MDVQQAGEIINAVEDGWIVVAVSVPTRGVRVVRNESALLFRVEQLQPKENFRWVPVSSHQGDEPWESLGPALDDLIVKQTRLREKLKLAMHERTMAEIKAREALEKTVH